MDRMKHLKGFPALDVGVEAVAGALLRIAHPVIVEARLDWAIKGGSLDDFDPSSDIINPGAEALSLVTLIHPKIKTPINPMIWMVDMALDKYNWFPAPIDLRRIFVEKFPPADGQEPAPAEY
jgi:hypothetical protein